MAGIISYPRTETEKFSPEFDIQGTIAEFRQNTVYGQYAVKLLDQGKVRVSGRV